jgi:cyclopropane-fatty-acyl-phospholipid synthase
VIEKALLDRMLRRVKVGGLSVTYWDGETRRYGDPATRLHVTIKDPAVVRAMGRNPSLAIGEAYMDGTIEIDGPLEKLSELAYANEAAIGLNSANRLYRGLNRNVKSRQPELVSSHYDRGNDFYRLWLDRRTLGYSCAYYRTERDTLEQAEVQKFDHILNKLRLQPGQELLDIGFGWGYLLIRAAKRFKVRGLGVTLSRQQYEYALDWAKRERVDHLVTYELMNYQDLPRLKRQFDRVVSIGFFEHVGRGNHATYFKVVDAMLREGGVSVLHSITANAETEMDAWIDKYIFPGGYIPSIREVTALLPGCGFHLKDYENLGSHYIRTLEEWRRRFDQNKDKVTKMYDERFYRMWRFYLSGSIGAFSSGSIDLSQWVFTKGPAVDWPLTREYLYD